MRHFEAGSKHLVTQLQFRPDGSGITAALRRAKHLVTWDIASGTREKIVPTTTPNRVTCFAYSPDGAVLIIGDDNGVARVYQLPDLQGGPELVVGRDERVRAVAFSPLANERTQWVLAAGTQLQLRNLKTGEINAGFDEADYRYDAVFTPEGTTVLEGHGLYLVAWSIRSEEVFRVRCESDVTRVVFSPDGQRLALAIGTGISLRVGDDPTRPGPTIDTLSRSGAMDLTFTPDGRFLLVADATNAVKLFDPTTGTVAHEYDWGIGKVSAVAVSPDGTMAAAGGEKGQVVLWDLD